MAETDGGEGPNAAANDAKRLTNANDVAPRRPEPPSSRSASESVATAFRYALLAFGAIMAILFVYNAIFDERMGVPAPDVRFALIANPPREGQRDLSIADFKGKVVLLDFWATWCGPCRMQAPIVEEIYEAYKDKGVVVLGVNTDDANLSAMLVRKDGTKYPMLFDEGAGSAAFHVQDLPTLVIVDKNQKVAAVKVGVTVRARLAAILDSLL